LILKSFCGPGLRLAFSGRATVSYRVPFGGKLRKFLHFVACATFFGMTLGPALAADLPVPAPAPVAPAPTLIPPMLITVGLGAEVVNSFPGAKTYRVLPYPYFDWRKPGEPEPFHAPDDGYGVSLLNFGSFKAGPVARVIPDRGLSYGNGNFNGLPYVGWTLELGGFAEYWVTDFLRTRAEVRQGVNGHDGLDANIEIDAVGHYGQWTLSLGPRAAFGDDRFMSAYFSVTPAQAAANGLVTPYTAHGGLTSLGVMGSAKYYWTPVWSTTGFAGYNRLTGSAAASPISNNLGSKDELIAGVILEYTFAFGGF
jgi:outer membrane protein